MTYLACYETLCVKPGASMSEIHRAYKLLALQYHPDRAGGHPQSREAFCRITEAYATLRKAFEFKNHEGLAGPCSQCGDIDYLFKGVDGQPRCTACLLAQRRRLLPMPSMKTVRCVLSIILQIVAVYCLVISVQRESIRAGLVGLGSLFAALVALTWDVLTSFIVTSKRDSRT